MCHRGKERDPKILASPYLYIPGDRELQRSTRKRLAKPFLTFCLSGELSSLYKVIAPCLILS